MEFSNISIFPPHAFLQGLTPIWKIVNVALHLKLFSQQSLLLIVLVEVIWRNSSLYQTKPGRPPPLTCFFFSIETPLFPQATFYLAELFRQAMFESIFV